MNDVLKKLQRKQSWHNWSTIPALAWRWWQEESNCVFLKSRSTALPLNQPGWQQLFFYVSPTTDTQWTGNRMVQDGYRREILQHCCTNIFIIMLDTYYLIHQPSLLTKYYLLLCRKKISTQNNIKRELFHVEHYILYNLKC
jgi:hypothetical protein